MEKSEQPYYQEFQEVAGILRQIRSKIYPETDFLWAGFVDHNEFLAELNADIQKLESCDIATLKKIHVEFLPTCTYQEIAISNGWSNEYMELADKFDALWKRITMN